MAENLFDWQPQPTNSPSELNNYFSLEFATQKKKKEKRKKKKEKRKKKKEKRKKKEERIEYYFKIILTSNLILFFLFICKKPHINIGNTFDIVVINRKII